MTIQGGIIESKTIGVPIGSNGVFTNTELVNDRIQLSKNNEGVFYPEGMWTSRVIDIEDNFDSFGKVFVTNTNNGNSSIAVLTRTSDDGITFDQWTAIAMDGSILSVKRRFISVRIVFYASYGNLSIPITGIQISNNNQYVDGDNNSISLKRNYTYPMVLDDSWNQNGFLYRKLIDRNEWLSIDKLNVNGKSFILNNGEYKKITDTIPRQIQTISNTVPTYEMFNDDGMNSLSSLLDRTMTTLEPLQMSEQSENLPAGEIGKLFGKIINLNKYFDIKSIQVVQNNGVYKKILIKDNISNEYFSLLNDKLITIPVFSSNNADKYGINSFENFDTIYNEKLYVLQDIVSKDNNGLWKQILNRKPLSIKFK